MKILIDECLPVGLKASLTELGHECQTVRQAGFGSKRNGELLTLAEGRWNVLLTSDRNIKHEQNMTGRSVANRDLLREIESHEGLVAAHARLRSGSCLDTSRRGG